MFNSQNDIINQMSEIFALQKETKHPKKANYDLRMSCNNGMNKKNSPDNSSESDVTEQSSDNDCPKYLMASGISPHAFLELLLPPGGIVFPTCTCVDGVDS